MPNTRIETPAGKLPARAYRFSWRLSLTAATALAIGLAAGSAQTTPARAVGEQAPAKAIEPETPQVRFPSFAPLVKRVKAAVVSIRVKEDASAKTAASDDQQDDQGNGQQNPFEGTPFERFFNKPGSPFHFKSQPDSGKRIVLAQGSGFFISSDGYVVTNNHVAANAVSVEVVLDDGKSYPAKVIGLDSRTDLALLKVDGRTDFSYVRLSHADVEVGDWIVALGNPFGLGGTVTAGIVSARGRDIGEGPYDDFLQLDAPVNKGNSGGPTFDQSGEVIGVNTAIYSPSGGSVGIAFAIPAATVERVVTQLKDHGHVTRGWLGVSIQPVTPEIAESLGLKDAQGAIVSTPQPGSPAEKAGMQPGDVILEVNGGAIKDARDLARKIADISPNTDVRLTVVRGGSSQTVALKIGELADKPSEEANAAATSKTDMGNLGIRVAPASQVTGKAGTAGLSIISVEAGSAAQEAGLAAGDIILRVGARNVSAAGDLKRALDDEKKAGRGRALVVIKRGADTRFVAIPTSAG